MQSEDYASYSPPSYGQRRYNKSRVVTVTVLFAGLVIGVLAGRWSVNGINVFKEADPPTPPKDPHTTVLDEFEGMWVLPVLSSAFLTDFSFHRSEIRFHQHKVRTLTPPLQNPTKKRSLHHSTQTHMASPCPLSVTRYPKSPPRHGR